MKNNTKVRLHLSKTLFESIVKEVVSESKKMNMSGGAYTESVKMPKKAKKMEEVNATADTENMRRMHEMSSKEKMAKGLYKEDEMGSSDKYPVGTVLFKPKGNQTLTVKRVEGDKIFVVSDLTPNREFQWSADAIDDGIRTKEFQLKSSGQNEMQINVAEEGQMNEMTDAVSWEAVAAGMTAIGLAPLAINKLHQWWQKKHPESFKKAQDISAAMDRQAGNTPGQGHGVDPSKTFGPQNESDPINELMTDREHCEWCKKNNFDDPDCKRRESYYRNQGWINEGKKVMPKLNELRKQIKNK